MKRLSELNGLKIYSDRAKYVGTVMDTVIEDKEGTVLGLVFGFKGEKSLSVPYNTIMAIGDIVLVHTKSGTGSGA
ncbi:MAG: PRC-barrel domain-containing protein [Candidatus Hadarchaeales archaeon]